MAQCLVTDVKLTKHTIGQSESAMRELAKPLKQIGIDEFSYHRVYPNNLWVDLSTYVDYYDYYVKHKLYAQGMTDPHECFLTGATSIISNGRYQTEEYNNALICLKERLHVRNGFLITEKHENYSELFFFIDKQNTHTKFIAESYVSQLYVFIDYFKTFGAKLIAQAEKNKILFPCYSDINYINKLKKFSTPINHFKTMLQQGKKITSQKLFTTKEQECIELLYRYKTSKEVAQKLNISHRTVEHHFANARRRLGLKKTRDLLLIIERERLIAY